MNNDKEQTKATSLVEHPSVMDSKLPPTPDIPNPYHREDKLAQDYQDRSRRESIWNQGAPFVSDPARSDSGHSPSPRGEKDRVVPSPSSRPKRQPDRQEQREKSTRSTPRNNTSGERPSPPTRLSENSQRFEPRHSNTNNRNNQDRLEPRSGAKGRRGEPITLAEELELEHRYGKNSGTASATHSDSSSPEKISVIAELDKLTMPELIEEARKQNMEMIDGEPRQELIFRMLQQRIRTKGMMFGEGTLEILLDEFGFLRSSTAHYHSCPDDIYISPSQIRRFGLRNGLVISGQIRPPKAKERYFALLRIEAINHEDPNCLLDKKHFDHLTPTHPNKQLILEHHPDDLSGRIIDLVAPIGFGQRGLIVSPPRAGKTILLQKIAQSVLKNYPDSYVFVLLVDERPEEVTDMERALQGTHCEVISSTFDEPPARHIQVSEMVLEKAKRMVEYGKNVVIFLDSMTRLARAWNAMSTSSGKTPTDGVDSEALAHSKKFFGSARKMEEGGSLTIMATAQIETGSVIDDIIFEEFKGTGNLEIRLDRALAHQHLWPAIDIAQSGTLREEMILAPEEYHRMSLLRSSLVKQNTTNSMELLREKLLAFPTNAELLLSRER